MDLRVDSKTNDNETNFYTGISHRLKTRVLQAIREHPHRISLNQISETCCFPTIIVITCLEDLTAEGYIRQDSRDLHAWHSPESTFYTNPDYRIEIDKRIRRSKGLDFIPIPFGPECPSTDYLVRDMKFRVSNMKGFFDLLSTNNIPSPQCDTDLLHSYLSSLVQGQRSDPEWLKSGSWAVCPVNESFMPSDAKDDFVHLPTYYAVAIISFALLKFPELCSKIDRLEEALKKGLDFCSSRRLSGHGFDWFDCRLRALEIFQTGRVLEFLFQRPEFSHRMCRVLIQVNDETTGFLRNQKSDPNQGTFDRVTHDSFLKVDLLTRPFTRLEICDYIFAYGSNMNLNDLQAWLISRGYDPGMVLNNWVAKLDHHDFVWNYFSVTRDGGAANLEYKINSSVWGLLIEFKKPDFLRAIDVKEGHPTYYSRGSEPITVTRADGQEFEAWLYTASGNRAGRRDIRPTREYKEIVVSGAEKAGLPRDYIQKLKKWPTA